jgi:hypothetical protein
MVYKTTLLYTSVYTDTNETDVRRRFNSLREDDVFLRKARTLLKDDLLASEIQKNKNKRNILPTYDREPKPLARKLTEDADLDREFVADSRLWKQVGEVLES